MPDNMNGDIVDVLRQILNATDRTAKHVEGNETSIAVLAERVTQVTTIATRLHRTCYEGNGNSLIQTITDLKASVSHLREDLNQLEDDIASLREEKRTASLQVKVATISALISLLTALIPLLLK